MFTFFFKDGLVSSWETAKSANTERFKAFHRHMLEAGVYLPPSQFEAAFVGAAHDEVAIQATVSAIAAFS
jgi:glutamate-1-semialdehyde 2,1-aminomutase